MQDNKPTSTRRVFIGALRRLFENEGPTTAAAIAYFTLFSLFPALVLVIFVSDYSIGLFDLRETVVQKIIALVPVARQLIIDTLAEITQPSWGLLFSCLTIFLWSSSWVFMFIENALNRAWGVTSQRTFWRSRSMTLGMILLCCTLLAISIGLAAVIAAARGLTSHLDHGLMRQSVMSLFWQFLLGFIGLILTITVFTLIYKIIPNTKVGLLEALSGSIISGILWQIANYIFMWSLPYFEYQRVYGSVGAVIALLSWVYLSSLIMLFGAYLSVSVNNPNLEERKPGQPPDPSSKIGIVFHVEKPTKGKLN